MMTKKTVLHAENIHKTFRHPSKVSVLRGVDLTIQQGESIAIMGASGEGKTTLLNIIGTLEKPDKGSLTLLGKKASPAARKTTIGFVFQNDRPPLRETRGNILGPLKQ